MKKKEFNKLKIGDKVTIRTKEEMLKLTNGRIDQNGNIVVIDCYQACFFRKDMFQFCGKEYEIDFQPKSDRVMCAGTGMCSFTRKMLRGKYE